MQHNFTLKYDSAKISEGGKKEKITLNDSSRYILFYESMSVQTS